MPRVARDRPDVLERLDVPYLDASADALVWQLDAPVQPALARRRVERDSWALDLHLLGASHQVLVRAWDGAACSELVACRPGVAGHLPSAVVEDRAGLRYGFRSAVELVDVESLADRASSLVRRLGGRDDALVGAFPGSPHAVTAIEVTRSGWRTWHVYPQTLQVVTTETVLDR